MSIEEILILVRSTRDTRTPFENSPGEAWVLNHQHHPDTFSHVAQGLQQAAAMAFDDILKRESTLDKELAEILKN